MYFYIASGRPKASDCTTPFQNWVNELFVRLLAVHPISIATVAAHIIRRDGQSLDASTLARRLVHVLMRAKHAAVFAVLTD